MKKMTTSSCEYNGCVADAYAHGLCEKHWKQKYGGLKEANVGGKSISVDTTQTGNTLGRVFWFSVGECEVTVEELRNHYYRLNIPMEYFPHDPRMPDVFKNVCMLHHEKKGTMTVNGETVHYTDMVRPNGAKRELVRETKHEKLRHINMGVWELMEVKPGEYSIHSECFEPEFCEVFKQVTKELESEFAYYANVYRGKNIRDTLRNVIYSLPYISMRDTGGVYFVPETHADILDKMSQLMKILNLRHAKTATTTEIITLPVVDSAPHRDMLVVKYESDAKGKIDDMLKRTTEILKLRVKISPKTFAGMVEEKNRLNEVKKKYEEILQRQMDTTNQELDFLKEQLAKLMQDGLVDDKKGFADEE